VRNRARIDLLDGLAERDLWFGQWQFRAAAAETRRALRLEQHSYWQVRVIRVVIAARVITWHYPRAHRRHKSSTTAS
jgi:hypothetical protein